MKNSVNKYMSTKKTIRINSAYLKLPHSRPKRKTQKRVSSSDENRMRKKLIERVNTFQERNKNEGISELEKPSESKKDEQSFESKFNESLRFLEQLSQNRTKAKAKSQTLKTKQTLTAPTHCQDVKLHSKTFKLREPPPYSCLKGSTKPNYREWLKGQQNISNKMNCLSTAKPVSALPDKIAVDNVTANVPSIRSMKLNNIKQKRIENTKKDDLRRKLCRKKITTVRHKLGKSGRKISILIKNNETRKKIQSEYGLIKKNTIADVKRYLRKHNLIKYGSKAPNDVLKQMYEKSILAGDVHNKSSDNMIHNYMLSENTTKLI